MIGKRPAILLVVATLAAALSPSSVRAQDAGERGAAALESAVATATVEVDGRALFRVRGVSAMPAEQRAQRIAQRIVAVAQNPEFHVESLRSVKSEFGINIMAGDNLIMTALDVDAQIEGVSLPLLVEADLRRIRMAIEDYRVDRSPERLLAAGLYALVATVVVAVALFLVIWFARWFDALVERRLRRRIEALEKQSLRVLRAERVAGALRGVLRGLRMVTILLMLVLYVRLVLRLFPWTRAIGASFFDLVAGPLSSMARGLLQAIPNLIVLAILFFTLRFVVRLTRAFFDAIQRRTVAFAGFEPEWAEPTYRLARILIIAFGLVVAYPYIPGSQSAAFKGISVFLGVVFSLGSSGAIANAIAGYSLTYRRAFRLGDRVRIGDTVGDVVETRLQVTHLRSLKHEEVIIPNSLILNSQVVNYSSLASAVGLILHTTVGIGYETPWRQVEAMLLMAAERTQGILKEPRPFVLQQSLADFAVNYELNVYCTDAQQMVPLYTALHRNILDVFNEYGVQIMTPAYEMDPAEPKMVPRDQWYASPAAPPDRET
jgi:small-conductance mechanosensitive channel